MNKKTIKIIATIVLLISIVFIATSVFAVTPADLQGTEPTNTAAATEFANKIIGVIRTVGVILSVIILMILGIKYMMGSAEEKADYKKSMIPYLVGAVLIFMASTLSGAVYQFLGAK